MSESARIWQTGSERPVGPVLQRWATGTGTFGVNSVLSTGRDVGLRVGASSVTFVGPSGFTAVFTGTSTFKTPPGINADLVKNINGTFTLTYRKPERNCLSLRRVPDRGQGPQRCRPHLPLHQ